MNYFIIILIIIIFLPISTSFYASGSRRAPNTLLPDRHDVMTRRSGRVVSDHSDAFGTAAVPPGGVEGRERFRRRFAAASRYVRESRKKTTH